MPRPRYKLLGTYRAPDYRLGAKVDCEARGEVRFSGLSDARIPWPLGTKQGSNEPVLFLGLVDAVRREAACAVAEWWGVSHWMVNKWRRAVGVVGRTEGDRKLMADYGKRKRREELAAMWAKARDPGRRAKIAAARRGKPRPRHVQEALRLANVGRKATVATRRLMSEAHRKRGTKPPAAGVPWTAEEDRLLRSLPPAEVAIRTKRTLTAVYSRRHDLQLQDGRRK